MTRRRGTENLLLEEARKGGSWSVFPERESRVSRGTNDGPAVISTLLQGRSLLARRDEGEPRRTNASSSANYRLRRVFPVVAEEFYEGYRRASSSSSPFGFSSVPFGRETMM